ncbi:MAG: DUF4294 domain-containing protein [Bacteroidetes bacterium]|nr:DUF4294 domain-containing protein [Bacteroidota bacterium]
MKQPILFLLLFLFIISKAFPQDTLKPTNQTQVVDGDTLTLVDLNAVMIFPPVKFDNKRQAVRFDRLVYNIKKVYPYAKLAGERLKYYKTVLDTIPLEKARKIYMKKAEKELQLKFGDQIKDLTYSQGKILIKLIYRETGNSTYDIVKELRGGFTAFIWQTLARIFGYDLRTAYEPEGNDQVIEQIVLMIESGAL